MRKIFLSIALLFFYQIAIAQDGQLDSVKWVQLSDASTNPLKNGQYLVMELPEEHKKLGFVESSTKKSFLIGSSEFFSFSDIDSVSSHFDPNFEANVIDILFNESGAQSLLQFTMKWKGYKVGLMLNNKLVFTATLDISPISNGKMSIVSLSQGKELDILINSIKAASTH